MRIFRNGSQTLFRMAGTLVVVSVTGLAGLAVFNDPEIQQDAATANHYCTGEFDPKAFENLPSKVIVGKGNKLSKGLARFRCPWRVYWPSAG